MHRYNAPLECGCTPNNKCDYHEKAPVAEQAYAPGLSPGISESSNLSGGTILACPRCGNSRNLVYIHAKVYCQCGQIVENCCGD